MTPDPPPSEPIRPFSLSPPPGQMIERGRHFYTTIQLSRPAEDAGVRLELWLESDLGGHVVFGPEQVTVRVGSASLTWRVAIPSGGLAGVDYIRIAVTAGTRELDLKSSPILVVG